tara:strand:+ start:448 stop:717 length:270 start_codon:yes stop_codon:yes gene_type:complete
MSFNGATDKSNLRLLDRDILNLERSRGRGTEASALATAEARITTISNLNSKNFRRLNLKYVQEMIQKGNDTLAQNHLDALVNLYTLAGF